MCLKPVKIRVPFNRISVDGGQPLSMEVPCGNCAECKKKKRLEWHFRTYHECLDCVNKGGFIYFDTLTYAPEFLPMLSHYIDIRKRDDKGNIIYKDKDKKVPQTIVNDFSCFNRTHLRNFIKNLRRQLDYHYKGVKFKYFVTSEYGTDENYTHRPHYHPLFFVFGNIHPYQFSELVSTCWMYGRTDGLPYQTRKYVAEHVFGYDLCINKDNKNYLKVTNYVAKYITKDSTFQETINDRISVLQKHYDDETLKELCLDIDMFHRQSQGFGISYINNLSKDKDEYDFVNEYNACRIKDSQKVVLVIPLPTYYNRKLFYKMLKNEDGKYFWQPTYKGSLHSYNIALTTIEKCTNNLKNQLANLPYSVTQEVNYVLQERTLEDYAIYKLFYAGRCREISSTFINKLTFLPDTLTDNEANLYDWLHTIHLSKYVNTFDEDKYFSRDTENDTLTIPNPSDLFGDVITIPYSNNLISITFNENSCFAFRNFDKLTKYLQHLQKEKNEKKQLTFDFIEDLTKKFKALYNYG